KCAPVSLVFATLATPSPLLHFISFSSSFSRHESLATSKFPRSWLQICPFIFKQLQHAPPATLFFSCFCMVAGGWVGASPEGMLPSAQCSLSRIPAQSLHLRSRIRRTYKKRGACPVDLRVSFFELPVSGIRG